MLREFEKSNFVNMVKASVLPQPGEIWELNRQIRYYQDFDLTEGSKLYSTAAQNFLRGNTPPRYVMIVTEPELEIVHVMVLSAETDFISDVDLLISADISGLTRNLLAETWHVQPMLVDNLSQPVGNRLSREIYDTLLTVGDYFHGLVNQQPQTDEIERLGLKSGTEKALDIPKIAFFHKQEQAWSDVLTIPVATYHAYLKTVNFTNEILQEQLQIEQELAELDLNNNKFINLLSTSFNKHHTLVSRWLQHIFEPEWLDFSTLPNLANTYAEAQPIATRSQNNSQLQPNPDEIAATIQQLSSANNEMQRQLAAKRLGEIAIGNNEAIQALVNLLRSASDDETLWIAVESLRKVDPENPVAGVKRVKLIDLGMEIAGKSVALAVAFLQKVDGDVGVLVQVYPTANDHYLPADLKLILLTDAGEILREITARRADVCLQLKFSCEMGERFIVQVALGNATFSENFLI